MSSEYRRARNRADTTGRGRNALSDPLLKELLDHLAQELAREYIRLVGETDAPSDRLDLLPKDSKARRCLP